MEQIGRSAGPLRWTEPKTETVFIFDIYGTVHEIACDRSEGGRAARRQHEVAGKIARSVIQRWLAAVALAIFGLGIVAEPGLAAERTPISGVEETW